MHIARVEGVLYAEKDFNLEKHPEMEGVPNLQARAWMLGQGRVLRGTQNSNPPQRGWMSERIDRVKTEFLDTREGSRTALDPPVSCNQLISMRDAHLPTDAVLHVRCMWGPPTHQRCSMRKVLQVLKLMQSFKSQEFVTERYSWRYYYW